MKNLLSYCGLSHCTFYKCSLRSKKEYVLGMKYHEHIFLPIVGTIFSVPKMHLVHFKSASIMRWRRLKTLQWIHKASFKKTPTYLPLQYKKIQFLYPSKPFSFVHFNMRHPVKSIRLSVVRYKTWINLVIAIIV